MKLMRGLLTVVCSVLWAASAQAQTCLGQTPFEAQTLRAGGQVSFSANTWGVGGGVGKDFEQFFASGGAIVHGFTGGGGSAKGFYGGAGMERKVGADSKFSVCPVGNLAFLWGPGDGVTNMLFNVGGMVGFDWMKSGNTQMVPTFGVTINVMRTSFDAGGFDFSGTNTFALLHAGMGFHFNGKMALVPTLAIDLGSDSAETIFSVVFSTKIGK